MAIRKSGLKKATLSADPLNDGGFGFSIDKDHPVSVDVPGPINVNVTAVNFSSNGTVSNVRAKYGRVSLFGQPGKAVKDNLNKALQGGLGKGDVANLLKLIANFNYNQTGTCADVTTPK